MSDIGADGGKTCVMCGTDCTAIPRAKDKRGRYFCRPCYDRALAKARERKLGTAAAPAVGAAPRPVATRPKPKPAGDDAFADLMGLESSGAAVETVRLCPGCRAQLPARVGTCPGCGYDVVRGRKAGEKAESEAPQRGAKRGGGGGLGMPSISATPKTVGLILLAVMLTLFGLAHVSTGMVVLYLLVAGLYAAVVGIWGLVTAFRDGVGTGLLYMFVPFYFLYFVFARSGNPMLQVAFGISLMNVVLRFFVPGPPVAE